MKMAATDDSINFNTLSPPGSPMLARETQSDGGGAVLSPPSPSFINRKGVPLTPERSRRFYQSGGDTGSPLRRPATPLRGIGKFLQHRRRDASPDSPSVRSDLLSGSVVAGLVATAIQEVESSAPDPLKNKPMADLVERAVKAEFKLGQLELQKKQIWQLVAIEEQQTDKERAKQKNLVIMMLSMLLIDVLVMIGALITRHQKVQEWIGSILVGHVSMIVTGAYLFEQLCFAKKEDDDEEEEEDTTADGEEETPVETAPAPASTPEATVSDRENSALDELKETLALLPSDQKGMEWITRNDHDVYRRFLRGHLLRVSKAFKYLVKCAEWRVDFNANTIVQAWEHTNTRSAVLLRQTFPLYILPNNVAFFRLSMCDFPGYFRACAVEDVTRHTVYEFERNRSNAPMVLIVDLGFNPEDDNKPINSVGQLRAWIAALMQYLGTMTKILDPYYPDMFSKIIFIRAPAPFWATWRVAQLLIPERTRDKIVILSGENVEAKLKEFVSVDSIPDLLGGKAAVQHEKKGGVIVPPTRT